MRVISGAAKGTKLNSIDSILTRPTLDRVKESLFNIIQNKIENSIVLDLFSGSGAIGIEFLSRNARQAYFCDISHQAINMINQNLAKTRLKEKSVVLNCDYLKALKQLKQKDIQFDIIYIDPPYKKNIGTVATDFIITNNMLKNDGTVIIETDEEEREINNLKQIDVDVKDIRKYGRVSLIFLSRKG